MLHYLVFVEFLRTACQGTLDGSQIALVVNVLQECLKLNLVFTTLIGTLECRISVCLS